MASSSIPFTSSFLQLPPNSKFSHISTPLQAFTHHSSRIRMCGVSALPNNPRKTRKKSSGSSSSEVEDLVRSLMWNFTDKQPLMHTLNKYVKFVRTEHCFLLFEELGRSDKWTQCIEVSLFTCFLSKIFVWVVQFPYVEIF